MLGVFFFLWFLTALVQVLRSIDADGFLTTLATVGGAAYAALALAGISLWTAIATMSDDTFHHQIYPGIIHAGSDAGYVIHASGGVGAGTMIIAASLAASRAALIPRWAGIVGIVFGILGIVSIFFFPQALIAIWILVAGGGWCSVRRTARSGRQRHRLPDDQIASAGSSGSSTNSSAVRSGPWWLAFMKAITLRPVSSSIIALMRASSVSWSFMRDSRTDSPCAALEERLLGRGVAAAEHHDEDVGPAQWALQVVGPFPAKSRRRRTTPSDTATSRRPP